MILNDIFFNLPKASDTSKIKDYLPIIISIFSVFISVFAIMRSIRLSVKQALLKLAVDKARDCNAVWNELNIKYEKKYGIKKSYPEEKYEDVLSELKISSEVMANAYKLFRFRFFLISFNYVSKRDKKSYSYTFWKLLRTDVRGFFVRDALKIALGKDGYFCREQWLGVYEFVTIIGKQMEGRPSEDDVSKLKAMEMPLFS